MNEYGILQLGMNTDLSKSRTAIASYCKATICIKVTCSLGCDARLTLLQPAISSSEK